MDWYPWPKDGAQEGGELARINQALKLGQSIEVDASLAELIRKGEAISENSGGAFNILSGRLTEIWQKAARIAQLPDALEVNEAVAALQGASLEWQDDILVSAPPNVMIDSGGIAKGTLLDEALALLQRHGIQHAIVDIGGDLAVLGTMGDRQARIGIRGPDGDGVIGWVYADSGEAIMTSGNYERFVELSGVRYSHIIDPRDGQPLQNRLSATVIHKDAALADAAATALMVGGFDEFERICLNLGLEYASLIDAAGDKRLTSAMECGYTGRSDACKLLIAVALCVRIRPSGALAGSLGIQ